MVSRILPLQSAPTHVALSHRTCRGRCRQLSGEGGGRHLARCASPCSFCRVRSPAASVCPGLSGVRGGSDGSVGGGGGEGGGAGEGSGAARGSGGEAVSRNVASGRWWW